MHGEHVVEIRRRQILEGALMDMAGIVDEQIHAAEGCSRFRHQRLDVIFARDITGMRARMSAGRRDGSRRLARPIRIQVIDHDGIAVLGKAIGDRPADAGTSACDNGSLHRITSRRREQRKIGRASCRERV